MSMNLKRLTKCSQDLMPKAIFNFGASSKMALRNSMRTKTWLLEKTTFPLKRGRNSCGAKAGFCSQRQIEPQSKAILHVEATNNIINSVSGLSTLVYHFI